MRVLLDIDDQVVFFLGLLEARDCAYHFVYRRQTYVAYKRTDRWVRYRKEGL